MSEKEETLEMYGDEIPDSQVHETEPQSSCETLMSQESGNEELSGKLENKSVEVSDLRSAETSLLNSSLEANTSGGNAESSYAEKPSASGNLENVCQEERTSTTKEDIEGENKGDGTEEKDFYLDDSGSKTQDTRKRKDRSDDSTPSPKRLRKTVETVREEEYAEQKHSPLALSQEHSKFHEVSVMEISSTPEKTIFIDDSQEFSLRIEESSPPTTQSIGDKSETSQRNQATTPLESAPAKPVTSPAVSSAPTSLSQKSAVSWTSHTQDQNLSWGSVKDHEYEKDVKEENGEHASPPVVSEKDSSTESLSGKNANNVSSREVTEVVTGLIAVTWVIDANSRVVSAKVKQISLLEEHPSEKPGRMSTVSTSSAKSSSSAGSVGLPGPFPLPGKTAHSRFSTLSTISTTTSSSSASNQAWDGPFLKPQVPGSKVDMAFSCDKCGHLFPPVDRPTSSPIVNGCSPIVEELEHKSIPPKRGPKGSSSSSAELLEEETSSSASQPQASSTPTRLPRGRPRKNGTTAKVAKKEANVTPVRTPRSVGRPKNGTATKKVEEGGAPVLARWGDGHYYPGWVSEPLADGTAQVLVRYCDGQSKPTVPGKVVRADVITPGTLVLAATRSGEYEEALVVQVDSSGAEPIYTVERDKTQREVPFANVALQHSTVVELTVSEAHKTAAATNFNDLSLENIIAHPRKRSARTPVGSGTGSGRKKKRQTTPQPCTSHGQTYSGPEEACGDTDSSTHSTCSLDLRGKEIRPLDVECFPAESLETKLVYSRGNMAFKKKEDKTDMLVKLGLGPIPEPGSQLFSGCVFLITYTDNVKLKGCNISYSSVEDSSGGSVLNLWKDRLRMQIRNGGGKVYNSFSEVTKDELPHTYLITDKQSNTPLYLQCLVHNVPIYSHTVVIQCCTQNRPWKEMIAGRGVKRLLAGYSLARRCLVNPKSSTPLRGRTLLLALSGDASLSAFWQSLVIRVGGAVDLYPHSSLESVRYDAVVTDAECDRDLVKEACDQRVPLVSVTWLQQVIITGEWRSPTEHPLYKYNASGEEEGESPEY